MPVNQQIPPKLANRFLRWFLRGDLLEEVEGDLEEQFFFNLTEKKIRRAKMIYWFQVINYLRPFALTKTQLYPITTIDMFKNYIKIGWRNLFRNLGYSSINIGGMALGLTSVILIGLWVYDELSFDSSFENREQIGQVIRTGSINGETYTTPWVPYALSEELNTNYSEYFTHVIPAFSEGSIILGLGEDTFSKTSRALGSSAIDAFSLPMLSGDSKSLEDPYSIIISESLARTIFGDEDPYYQILTYNNKHELTVTGVYKDLPHNSSFRGIECFVPASLVLIDNPWMTEQGFTNNFLSLYVEIAPGKSFADVSSIIEEVIYDHVKEIDDYAQVHPQLFIHPMEKWHLYGEWDNGVNTGQIRFVKLFGTIGLFILILACINFMNLSTARSEKRAKEVGIRKSIGSRKQQLIYQFLTESCLLVSLSFILSLLVSTLVLGSFNQLADKQIVIPWSNPYFWLAGLLFILITGTIAGSYPSFYLSSFNPTKILKGTFKTGRFSSLPRKILVVVQFSVSVILIIGTLIIFLQIDYAKDRPVGYDKEGLVMVEMTTDAHYEKYETIKNKLKTSGDISDVAQSLGPVTKVWSSNGGFTWKGNPPFEEGDFATLSVSANFGDVVGWKFIDGRNFSEEMASDSSGVILNETAVSLFGMDNPVGESITWAPSWGESRTFRIVGVIKDVVMRSPYFPNMPAAYFIDNRNITHYTIRIDQGANTADALAAIEDVFTSVIPNVPFTYEFADDAYAKKFEIEERIGNLASVFAILAIIISCLGLFGLAAFVAEQRTKEIGIRKVVGASVLSLWGMQTKNFILLVFISSLISIPVAYFGMNTWLTNYEYRITIPWWIFGLTIIGALLIAVLTVSFQAIRAARLNPVSSLRSE